MAYGLPQSHFLLKVGIVLKDVSQVKEFNLSLR
jgi:hypothetical protein